MRGQRLWNSVGVVVVEKVKVWMKEAAETVGMTVKRGSQQSKQGRQSREASRCEGTAGTMRRSRKWQR